ncbi:MAG TPA: helix-turn-helix transcriptional regulator [Candidatus Binatia bacterium]|nr:helix-turn-helix transcriptional regulator [Candidatus Binatia bacterium]
MPKRKKADSASSDAQRAHRAEELIRQATETIYDAMKKKAVTKAELARRLGRTNAYVSQILSRNRNLTLRTLADVALALEVNPRIVLSDKSR